MAARGVDTVEECFRRVWRLIQADEAHPLRHIWENPAATTDDDLRRFWDDARGPGPSHAYWFQGGDFYGSTEVDDDARTLAINHVSLYQSGVLATRGPASEVKRRFMAQLRDIFKTTWDEIREAAAAVAPINLGGRFAASGRQTLPAPGRAPPTGIATRPQSPRAVRGGVLPAHPAPAPATNLTTTAPRVPRKLTDGKIKWPEYVSHTPTTPRSAAEIVRRIIADGGTQIKEKANKAAVLARGQLAELRRTPAAEDVDHFCIYIATDSAPSARQFRPRRILDEWPTAAGDNPRHCGPRFKVGFSRDWEKRRSSLRTGNIDIVIVATFPVLPKVADAAVAVGLPDWLPVSRLHAYKTEQAVHGALRDMGWWVANEWYSPALPALKAAMIKPAAEAPAPPTQNDALALLRDAVKDAMAAARVAAVADPLATSPAGAAGGAGATLQPRPSLTLLSPEKLTRTIRGGHADKRTTAKIKELASSKAAVAAVAVAAAELDEAELEQLLELEELPPTTGQDRSGFVYAIADNAFSESGTPRLRARGDGAAASAAGAGTDGSADEYEIRFKVGKTVDPDARFSTLRTSNVGLNTQVLLMWTPDRHVCEKALHASMQGSGWHLHGEWFVPAKAAGAAEPVSEKALWDAMLDRIKTVAGAVAHRLRAAEQAASAAKPKNRAGATAGVKPGRPTRMAAGAAAGAGAAGAGRRMSGTEIRAAPAASGLPRPQR